MKKVQKEEKSFFPAFSIIRNSIITPLLLARERVVEYIVPEKEL
jgi:hypothetical protein